MNNPSDPKFLRTDTVGECWLQCVRHVLDNGISERDEDVAILEVLGLSVEVTKPSWHDPVMQRYGDPEVISRTLAKFSKGVSMPDRPFTYGERIFDMSGTDQFEWIVARLHSKREAKSATICLLVPGSETRTQPCLTTLDAKIRSSRLELQFFFRSQNILGRQYANLLALSKFQADLAARCLVQSGSLRGYIASAHIYSFDVPTARQIVSGKAVLIRDQYYSKGPKSVRSGNVTTKVAP